MQVRSSRLLARGFASLAVNNMKLGVAEPLGAVGASQVAVAMVAAPVHAADLANGSGIGGLEGVGCVTSVGSGVKNLKEGDWVVPKLGFGSWRSEALVEAATVTMVANDIPAAYAATMQTDAATAYRLLKDNGLSAGDWLIQSGADTPVGMAVIQLARDMGIKTINVISSEGPDQDKTLRLLTNLGGDINATDLYVHSHGMNAMLKGEGVKLALAGEGGDVVTEMARVLSSGASMLTYGTVDSKNFVFPEEKKPATVANFDISAWYAKCDVMHKAQMFADIAGAVRENRLSMFFQEHDFDDFEHAITQSTHPWSIRKVVLRMDHPDRMAEHDALPAAAYEVFEA